MKNIGEKIKDLRLKLGLSQSNLFPTNQSAVAQIETGRNQNPTANTLRVIASNLEISFDELTKGTNWKNSSIKESAGAYGFSKLDFELHIDKKGEISISHKRYPKFDSNNLENKYCPTSGQKLLFDCQNCKKPILDEKQTFCMGCGKQTFLTYKSSIYEIVDPSCSKDEALDKIKIKRDAIFNTGVEELPSFRIEQIKKYLGTPWGDEEDIFTNLMISLDINGINYSQGPFSLDEYLMGSESNNTILAKWYLESEFKHKFLTKLMEVCKVNNFFSDNQKEDLSNDRI